MKQLVVEYRQTDDLGIKASVPELEGAPPFQMVTCMFAFHEMPDDARYRVLRNMLRVAPVAIVVDIHPSYEPSARMLEGEPYLASYLQRVGGEMTECASKLEARLDGVDVVPGRVRMWRFTRRPRERAAA